jgi:hypothetical protein
LKKLFAAKGMLNQFVRLSLTDLPDAALAVKQPNLNRSLGTRLFLRFAAAFGTGSGRRLHELDAVNDFPTGSDAIAARFRESIHFRNLEARDARGIRLPVSICER